MVNQNRYSSATLQSGLKSMAAELNLTKKRAADFLNDLNEVDPGDIMEQELPGEPGAAMEDPEKEKEHKHKIKTPEDAKNVLDEAKSDIQDVVDNIDGICGQVEEEEKKASFKRQNDKYASNIQSLAQMSQKVIQDADDAISHWAFLSAFKNPAKKIQNSDLKQVANTLEDVERINQTVERIARRKLATAVPPTGAEFSGDKWPEGKNPAEVENRSWAGGAEKFHRDRKFEDSRPNPSVDNRLNTVDYSRDDKPHVNASFVIVPENKYASYWDIEDTLTGKRIIADFSNAPSSLGTKNENGFRQFSSQQYGERIINKIMDVGISKTASESESGIELVRKMLNGRYASLSVEAKEPKVKDKATIRRYYKDAYGDGGYAKEMTANKTEDEDKKDDPKKDEPKKDEPKKEESKEAAENTDGMDIGYKPADEHPKDKNTGEAKDGTGKLSSQDPQAIKAKAFKAVELARKYAAIGAIQFTKEAILSKAREIQKLSNEEFEIKDKTISELPIVNEAALKSAHIPDTETGVVGNPAEGVSDPKAQVKTDGIDTSVKSDAKVSSIVPQMIREANESNKLDISSLFTTTASRLRDKGIIPEKARIMRPKYRS